jgi:rubredoxin
MSDIAIPKDETVNCPLCNRGKIEITIIPEHYSYHSARAFGKVKRIPVVHPERVTIHNKCPNCGASKSEIKEALEHGQTKKKSHKELMERLKKQGLPTQLEF